MFISCGSKDVVFEDVDIYYSISLTEDLNRISDIKTIFNTPLESGLLNEKRTEGEYIIEINNIKCPTTVDFDVIFEIKNNITINEDLKLKKIPKYKVRRNFSDGSFLDEVSVIVNSGSVQSYDYNEILEFFDNNGVEHFIRHFDKEGYSN